MSVERDVVTGAFGFTGRAIATRLLAGGRRVTTLTAHPGRPDPFGGRVAVAPLDFGDPSALRAALDGAATLYNTYWVRFAHGAVDFERAVENTRALFEAARAAGVGRVVHVSIASAWSGSPLPYFRGKGLAEEALAASGLHYAVVRPALVFGEGDILVNNIAWMLRRFPVFAVPGDGSYRVRPVHVDEVAAIAVEAGAAAGDAVIGAVGPETLRFGELVRLVAAAVGSRARVLNAPPSLALLASRLIGVAVHDVILTGEEVRGLMAGLLAPGGPATGSTRFSAWITASGDRIGRRYASELARHFR